MKAQSGRRRTALFFFYYGAKRMFCCQRHTPDFYPINYCAGGMVGHRAAMYAAENFVPDQEWFPGPSTLQLVAILTTIYSITHRHISIPNVFGHLRTVNSAAKISAVKLEQERTLILTPISAIVLEILISFPW